MKILSLCFCVLALSACKTTIQDGPHKVIIKEAPYHHHHDYDDDHDHDRDGRHKHYFCPPGQAKKGNC